MPQGEFKPLQNVLGSGLFSTAESLGIKLCIMQHCLPDRMQKVGGGGLGGTGPVEDNQL